MRSIKYVVYKEGNYYVSQCLNVDVSSFGDTIDEAIASLKEAVSLYFENDKEYSQYQVIDILTRNNSHLGTKWFYFCITKREP